MGAGPEAHAGYLIGRVDRIIRRSFEAVLDSHGVTLAQYTALSVLAARPGLSSAQLARRSLVSPQGMNNIVNDLENKGLIERTPHENGGRILRVAISPQGVKVLELCDEAVSQIEDALLSSLTDEHRALFVSALQVLARVPEL
jgi:DNA-binding MarR family transcriptional regulator